MGGSYPLTLGSYKCFISAVINSNNSTVISNLVLNLIISNTLEINVGIKHYAPLDHLDEIMTFKFLTIKSNQPLTSIARG